MKKVILEKKEIQNLPYFLWKGLALAHFEAGIWILTCVPRMYVLSAFQQCEYSHACKFLGMGEEYLIFSKEQTFYLLKSLLNLIQPGIQHNLPFTSRCTIGWVKVPENKARSRLTLFKIPLLSDSNVEDTPIKCGGGRIKLMERRGFRGKE